MRDEAREWRGQGSNVARHEALDETGSGDGNGMRCRQTGGNIYIIAGQVVNRLQSSNAALLSSSIKKHLEASALAGWLAADWAGKEPPCPSAQKGRTRIIRLARIRFSQLHVVICLFSLLSALR
jgi:hypothetical protein